MAAVKFLVLSALLALASSAPSDKKSAKAPATTSNAAKEHYTVVTIPDGAFVAQGPDCKGEEFCGFFVDLLKMIAKEGNFTYDIKKQPDGQYGKKVNGKWNGMIGQLVDGTADIALGNIVVTKERATVIEASPITANVTLWAVTNPKFGSDVNKVQYVATNGLLLYLLKHSDDAVAQKVYANIKKGLNASIVATSKDGINKVKSGAFAYVTDEDSADNAEDENAGKVVRDQNFPISTTDAVAPFIAKKGSNIAHKLSLLLLNAISGPDDNPELSKIFDQMLKDNAFSNFSVKK